MPNAWDIGPPPVRVARIRGDRHHERRVRRHPRPPRRCHDEGRSPDPRRRAGRSSRHPVSADLENCFATTQTACRHHHDRSGRRAGRWISGGFHGRQDAPIYELATRRTGCGRRRGRPRRPNRFVLTARPKLPARRQDLADTITRLQAYQEAGADVLFAPAVVDPGALRQLLGSVDVPVSVLVLPGAPTVGELAELGVSRISVGGAIAVAAYGAAINAVTELRDNAPRAIGIWPPWPVPHRRRIQSLTATVTSISTARSGQRSHADAERVWRPASPKTSARLCSPRPPRPAADGSPAPRTRSRSRSGLASHGRESRAPPADGQRIQRAHGGGFGPLFHRHGVAQSPRQVSSPAMRGSLPRRTRHPAVHDHCVQRVVRRMGAVSVRPNSASRALILPSLAATSA